MFSFYPNAIKKSKLYQLLENKNEEWEMHVFAYELFSTDDALKQKFLGYLKT